MLEDNQIALCFPCKHAVFGFANELSYVTLVVMGHGCLSGIFPEKNKRTRAEKKCYFYFPVYSCVYRFMNETLMSNAQAEYDLFCF